MKFSDEVEKMVEEFIGNWALPYKDEPRRMREQLERMLTKAVEGKDEILCPHCGKGLASGEKYV